MEATKARLDKNTTDPVIDISNCLKAAQVLLPRMPMLRIAKTKLNYSLTIY